MSPITGTFFDIVHHSPVESRYWAAAVAGYHNDEWRRFMEHMKESGLDTVILIGTVSPFVNGKALFPGHPFLPTHEDFPNFDPVEASLAAADEAGLDYYPGLGFQESYSHEIVHTKEAVKRTLDLAETLLARYGGHSAFAGWYIADEFGINEHGRFNPGPVQYVRDVVRELKRMTPEQPCMVSPYFHTDAAEPDPAPLRRQLDTMGVDIISIQNGANHPRVTARYFEQLEEAFRESPWRLWGNVELFALEDPSAKRSPLIPGPLARIREQMAWIDPYVEKLISYQFPGLMNTLGLGKQPDARDLWDAYMTRQQDDGQISSESALSSDHGVVVAKPEQKYHPTTQN